MGEYDQRPQMEDPTMVGTLEMQAQMIWPLERPLLEASGIGAARRIVDLGCGTGRIAGRVAAAWPEASVLGVDLCAAHLEVARADHPPSTHPNLTFRECDARNTGLAGADFDAVLVRHVLHALGDRELLLAEARRLLRPGGLLHVLAEDYQGLLFDTPREDDQLLFREAREALLPTGTDLDHGRRAFRDVVRAGFVDVRVHPLIVDVQNADRGVYADMLVFWRDGYADLIAQRSGRPAAIVRRRFDGFIEAVRDPARYGCWLLFVVTGRGPDADRALTRPPSTGRSPPR